MLQITKDEPSYFTSAKSKVDKERCSTFKDSNIKSREEYDKIVNPVLENPDDFFDYLPTGEIYPKLKEL